MGNFMPYVNRAAQAVAAAQAAQAVAAAQTRAIQLRDASIMNWAMRRHPGDWEGSFADFYKNGGSRIGGLAQEKARDTYRQAVAQSGAEPEGRGPIAEQEKAPFQRQWGAALAVGKKANWDPLITQQGVNAAMMETMIAHPRVAARMRNAWAQTPQDPQARVKYLEGQYASTGARSQQTEVRSQETPAAAQSAGPQAPQAEPRPSGSGSEPDEAAAQPEEEQ
ncbi:MAG TPA: hypothetical protein VIY49_19060 [Bryobacteraceae bacterium]